LENDIEAKYKYPDNYYDIAPETDDTSQIQSSRSIGGGRWISLVFIGVVTVGVCAVKILKKRKKYAYLA